MTAPLYVSRCTMDKLGSLHRRAHLVHGATADMGVHGPIRELFQLAPERELPLPVDYVVAAVAGCMFGTLNGALEVRQIKLSGGDMTCAAEGDNEVRDGIPVLHAEVFPDNVQSSRVLEKAGFELTGRITRDLPLRGGERELLVYENSDTRQ